MPKMRPATPNEQMKELDTDGTAYWLADVVLTDGRQFETLEVMSHSETWLLVRIEMDRPFYLQARHIMQLSIIEG